MMRSPDVSERMEPPGELDLRAIGAALKRRRRMVIMPTLLAFVAIAIFVNVVTPRYTAETQILLENQETYFTRPDRPNLQPEQAAMLDQEAVASQVELISSHDIARRAIKQLGLSGDPEFDPLAGGLNPLTRVLILLGVVPDPTRESVDQRIVTKFLDKLTVFSPPKTRIITIQFSSRHPELAMRAANTIAQLYLQEQSAAKRTTARIAADALASEIADLRTKLVAADDDLQQYRLKTGLLAGSNNMTISAQQLTDINADLSKARSNQADAQAKASMIRELIRAGRAADVTEVINNDLVRRISEQRVTAQAQLALESRTLLPGHPHIKELSAQVAEYDLALKAAAKQAEMTLENEAKIAGQRVANLETVLSQQKQLAGVANVDEVHLRALERITQTYKDQLDSSSTKYQEALARQSSTATPSDARIVSTASRPQEPSFPKKVPFIGFGTVAALLLSSGLVIASELLSSPVLVEPVVVRAADRPAPPPLEAQPDPLPAVRPRRAWTFPRAPQTPEAAPDPVFAPVGAETERGRRAEKLKMLATGGMLAATLSYIKAFGRSAASSRESQDETAVPPPPRDRIAKAAGWNADEKKDEAVAPVPATSAGTNISALAERIVAAHVPGRGLHVVGTGLGKESRPDILIDLGRALSGKGRAIMVDLNRTPAALAALAAPGDEGRTKVMTLHGLAELLANTSTFAEVIHRDQASRLHYIPTGLEEADFRDFDLILDALSETYDFIVLLAPAVSQSEIAKIMAPYTDFVVLATTRPPEDKAVSDLEGELVEAGAREVLIASAVRAGRQDVA